MNAAGPGRQAAADATPESRLRFETIDARAAELGITTDTALAEFLGMHKSSLWRFRHQLIVPSLDTALRIAERMNLSVEDVAERLGESS